MAVEVTRSEVAVPTPHRFTVDDYYRMAEVGILGPTDRVQLVGGVIVDMPPSGPDHSNNVVDLNELFMDRFRPRAIVRPEQPISLGKDAQPEPDLALVRRRPGPKSRRGGAHPRPEDTLLVVEVSDSTLDYDLGTKAHMYAEHGIDDLWVLDIRGERLIVHRAPSATGYTSIRELRRGDSIAPLAFPDVVLTIDEILGEPD